MNSSNPEATAPGRSAQTSTGLGSTTHHPWKPPGGHSSAPQSRLGSNWPVLHEHFVPKSHPHDDRRSKVTCEGHLHFPTLQHHHHCNRTHKQQPTTASPPARKGARDTSNTEGGARAQRDRRHDVHCWESDLQSVSLPRSSCAMRCCVPVQDLEADRTQPRRSSSMRLRSCPRTGFWHAVRFLLSKHQFPPALPRRVESRALNIGSSKTSKKG